MIEAGCGQVHATGTGRGRGRQGGVPTVDGGEMVQFPDVLQQGKMAKKKALTHCWGGLGK